MRLHATFHLCSRIARNMRCRSFLIENGLSPDLAGLPLGCLGISASELSFLSFLRGHCLLTE